MLRALDGPRRLPSEIDLALLWSTLMLLVIGMVMVYSASMATAEAGRDRPVTSRPTFWFAMASF
jgi:cell division protein FtsW